MCTMMVTIMTMEWKEKKKTRNKKYPFFLQFYFTCVTKIWNQCKIGNATRTQLLTYVTISVGRASGSSNSDCPSNPY